MPLLLGLDPLLKWFSQPEEVLLLLSEPVLPGPFS